MQSAELDEAAKQGAKARIQNTGQSCICAKRMIVHTDIYDAFMEKFAAAMRMVKDGDPMDPQTDMGPLSSFAQRDTVLKQLDDAKKLGETLMFGGQTLAGNADYISDRQSVETGKRWTGGVDMCGR